MLTKTTIRWYHTTSKMAKPERIDHTQCWRGCGASGILLHCWWESQIIRSLKIVWEFLRNIPLPYELKISFENIRPQKASYKDIQSNFIPRSPRLETAHHHQRMESSYNGILLSSMTEWTIDDTYVWILKTLCWVESQMSGSFWEWMTGKGQWGSSGIKQTNDILGGVRVTQLYTFVKRDWNICTLCELYFLFFLLVAVLLLIDFTIQNITNNYILVSVGIPILHF